MKRYGLIGYPLSHSRSKVFFEELFLAEGIEDCSYENFSLHSDEAVKEFLRSEEGLCGLNVTSPYKRIAVGMCNEISEAAMVTGSVNCIGFNNGSRLGFNTDVFGFMQSLESLLLHRSARKALVLGTGGAASAAIYGLRLLGIEGMMIGRSSTPFFPEGYSGLGRDELSSFDIIVNCTPLGTWPDIMGLPPIPYGGIHRDQILFDMVYNPEITAFMRMGRDRGCVVKNGDEMLRLQAIRSWEIWQGKTSIDIS